ncbi:TetR/AcrR family transcriptional regulator [Radicibacter daui]|uniref:TetR/AcrR family transcriptional regulator n=1 Tax=Radicibacter daui TaxID=3064829 RepID=UPI004046FF83
MTTRTETSGRNAARSRPGRADRRTEALSREKIVAAAIGILDAEGESALTFRALAARLSTGAGALYWHVADKGELLAAASDDVLTRTFATLPQEADPASAIRTLALAMFDMIDRHPWVGTQFFREPWQLSMLRIVEGIGGPLQKLGVPDEALFDCGSALLNYILGVGGQNAANARLPTKIMEREPFLADVARRWKQLDPQQFPFVHRVADSLPGHNDRQQFVAGVDLILAGIEARYPAARNL